MLIFMQAKITAQNKIISIRSIINLAIVFAKNIYWISFHIPKIHFICFVWRYNNNQSQRENEQKIFCPFLRRKCASSSKFCLCQIFCSRLQNYCHYTSMSYLIIMPRKKSACWTIEKCKDLFESREKCGILDTQEETNLKMEGRSCMQIDDFPLFSPTFQDFSLDFPLCLPLS